MRVLPAAFGVSVLFLISGLTASSAGDLQSQITTGRSAAASLQSQINADTSRIKATTASLSKAEHRLATLQAQLNAREARLRAVQTALRTLSILRRTETSIKRMAAGQDALLRFSTECYTAYHWLPPLLDQSRTRAQPLLRPSGNKNPERLLRGLPDELREAETHAADQPFCGCCSE